MKIIHVTGALHCLQTTVFLLTVTNIDDMLTGMFLKLISEKYWGV